jgi:hypothetical protein
MTVNPDFRDLFSALNDAGADFLVVGGYALAVHGHPRFTKDLDVWARADEANALKVWMGLPPNRIDVLTGIDGVTFQEAWEHRIESQYGDQPVRVIGLEDLIQNKLSTGRPQDALDVKTLRGKS